MGQQGVLLVGPTGAGKTPLGDYLEGHGWGGRRCVHFDFGAQLRAVAAGGGGLSAEDVEVVRQSLRTGALLEDSQFHIARDILRGFVGERCQGESDLVVLNGLPRHVGQARDIDAVVHVEAVISLECSALTVRQRIEHNSGGDRGGRVDDDLAAIQRKLDLFAARTRPLVEHYLARGVKIYQINVEVDTGAEDVWRQVKG